MSAGIRATVALSSATAVLLASGVAIGSADASPSEAGAQAQSTAALGLDLTKANRRAPISGLYDWSRAGYRGGENLPGPAHTNPMAAVSSPRPNWPPTTA